MKHILRSRSVLFAAATLVLASVATVWRYDVHPHSAHQLLPASSLVTIEAEGRATGVSVTETSLAGGPVESWTALDATVVGRISPWDEERTGGTSPPASPSGFWHDWPAVYASARFIGDEFVMAFDDEFNRYRVAFDNGQGPVVVVSRPERRAFLVSGLGPGEHHVRIETISEASGIGGLSGLYVPAGGKALPAPQPLARQIEFIGDSDSVGYGNLSTTRECTDDVFGLTDTQASFGPQVARHFGADYQLVASSGIGVVRNYGGADPDRTLPALYSQRLRGKSEPYLPSDWTPQIIVLALGSNDFQSPIAPEEPWTSRALLRAGFQEEYSEFLHELRSRYATAYFLLVMWPQYGSDYIQAHEAVLETARSAGDRRIDLIALPKMQRTGCDWHPTLDDHSRAFGAIMRYLELHQEVWEPSDLPSELIEGTSREVESH